MPRGTPVDRMYEALKAQGKDTATAAKIAQSRTGTSLKTGLPPKGRSRVTPRGRGR